MTTDGPTPGSGEPADETRVDWPASPPPPGSPLPAAPPPAAPPTPPPPTPAAPGYGAPGTAGTAWAPPPTAGAGQYAVPGMPALAFAGALNRLVAYIIDGILLAILASVLFGLIVAIAPGVNDSLLPRAILGIGLDALYFIAFWTSDGRATLGMRLLKLQVGNAFDGRKLELSQAVRRWIALGSWLSAFGYSTVAAGYAGTLLLIWSVVLLATTITSPTKQGLHDRFANSAVVQPVGGGNGIAMACLLILGLLVLLAVIAVLALIFLGGQVSSILSAVGTSVQP